MIVPRTRLLVWAAMVLLPFGTLAGMDNAARPWSIGAVLLFVVLSALDAAWAPRRLAGINLELPPVIRVTQGREALLPARVRNQRRLPGTIRLTLNAPEPVKTASDETTIALPPDAEWSEFEWPFRVAARGRFSVRSGRIETVSGLGFWAFWKDCPQQTEIRAYPNLMGERRNLAALFLNRGAVGLHAQRMVGKGREFEKLREYIPGDGYDEIHWKATAKRGQPVTKVFQIERTQEIYVVIDSSRLSRRETQNVAHGPPGSREAAAAGAPDVRVPGNAVATIDRFITAALVLGLAAEHQGDLFGLLTFSDKVETFVRARNGTAHYHACRDAIYNLQARDVTPDFEDLSTFIRLRLRRRALLLFLTSLDDPVVAESFVRSMDLLRRQHLVLVHMLRPPGAGALFSAGAQSSDDLYDHLGGHVRWQGLRELEKVLQRRGVRFTLVGGEELSLDLVSQYINVKQRQAI